MTDQQPRPASAVAEERMQFVAPKNIRIFQAVLPSIQRLGRTNLNLKRGDAAELDSVWLMYYDHAYRIATKVKWDGEEDLFILVEEIDDDLRKLCSELIQQKGPAVSAVISRQAAQERMARVVPQIVLGIRKYCRGSLKSVE